MNLIFVFFLLLTCDIRAWALQQYEIEIRYLSNFQNCTSNTSLDKPVCIRGYQTNFGPMPITWPFGDGNGYEYGYGDDNDKGEGGGEG